MFATSPPVAKDKAFTPLPSLPDVDPKLKVLSYESMNGVQKLLKNIPQTSISYLFQSSETASLFNTGDPRAKFDPN